MNRSRETLAGIMVSALAFVGCHSDVKPAPQSNATATGSVSKVTAVPVVQHQPVTNRYHGVAVVDEFNWLENAADPAVDQWAAEQNSSARRVLDTPTRPLIRDRLHQIISESGPDYFSMSARRGRLFALKSQTPGETAVLVTLQSITNLASERVILDPRSTEGRNEARIDWYVPSLDGRRAAVSLSRAGAVDGTLHVYDTASGQPAPDVIPRVQTPAGSGSVAWSAGDTGFFYTRYPAKGERPEEDLGFHQQVYFHQLGTSSEQDRYEIGRDFPRIARITLKSSPDGRYHLASVANGAGGSFVHYLRDPEGQWRQIADFSDQITQVEFGRDPLYIEWGSDEALYMLSFSGAPRGKVLRLPLNQPDVSSAAVAISEAKFVLASFQPAASGMCLVYQKGGPSEFAYLDYFDNTVRQIADPSPTAVREVVVAQGDDVLFRVETYTSPYEWLQYNPTRAKDRLASTPLAGSSPVRFTDVEVIRENVPSKDGTLVPLNILRKRGIHLNGNNPTILSGFGGFGTNEIPNFDVSRRLWFDHGGVFAIANVRGGSEFGPEWHAQGMRTNKQSVFDDFIACAEFLIRTNYTSPSRLAMAGGGQGGVMIGAALTQRPDLFAAAAAIAAPFDLLRAESEPIGAYAVTELGTVKELEQFQALRAYSPYHRVERKIGYPAVLILADESNAGTPPSHSRKMAARLRAASTSGKPVLLASTQRGLADQISGGVDQLADVYSFLYEQLQVEFSQIDRGPWSGAITPTTAVVKAKLIQAGLEARLLLGKSQSFTETVGAGPVRSRNENGRIVEFALSGLDPDTEYYYGLEINGRFEPKLGGRFRTFPTPGPASFTIAFSGDARTGSTSDVFDRIREHRPLFYMNLGDLHYSDIRSNSPALFREAYDAVLASPQQAALYRQVPFIYLWDDHDYGGNNSNRKSTAQDAARQVYGEYIPHYPMPLVSTETHDGPISQSFAVGRVKFIITDLRSERDDVRLRDTATKSMMGPKQKAWFKRELLAANGKYPLICWVSSVAWNGQAGTNVYQGVKTNQFGWIHHSQLANTTTTNRGIGPAVQDWWSSFSVERKEIADFIKANRIRGLCILHADAHMLAADDGTHSDYASGGGAPIPIMCAAPLDQSPSIKGGPYSQGIYRVEPGEGCFGLVTISDRGEQIDINFSGRNHRDEEKVSLKFSVAAAPTALGSVTGRTTP